MTFCFQKVVSIDRRIEMRSKSELFAARDPGQKNRIDENPMKFEANALPKIKSAESKIDPIVSAVPYFCV
jgi:hypothetical protein